MTERQNIGHVRADKPPSDHAMGVLASVAVAPMPTQEMNFTVRDKLCQWDYITVEERPSPYRSHKPGTRVAFAVATDKGREALATWKAERRK
jgi:hypothetical protein